jgi:hypothetical protein
MNAVRHLKRRFIAALFFLFIALLAAAAATFAWYIYNTNAHTTNVRLAAGTSASLRISSTEDGEYRSAALLDSFEGSLNPVSTNRIQGTYGFQKVYGFTNGSENQPTLVANLFGPGKDSDYYETTLYLRTNGEELKVYLSNIEYEDSDNENPISTAIRVGILTQTEEEYIFSINENANTGDDPDPEAGYNTAGGKEGEVLDSSKNDGSLIAFVPYTSDNFCLYDKETGDVTLKNDSVPICTVSGNGSGDYGEPVMLKVYIWLEGCDRDCTDNLCETTLKNLAISFAGFAQ